MGGGGHCGTALAMGGGGHCGTALAIGGGGHCGTALAMGGGGHCGAALAMGGGGHCGTAALAMQAEAISNATRTTFRILTGVELMRNILHAAKSRVEIYAAQDYPSN